MVHTVSVNVKVEVLVPNSPYGLCERESRGARS